MVGNLERTFTASLLFSLDNFKNYSKVKILLENKEIKEQIENVKNPENVQNPDEAVNYNKLINLALKKATYSLDDLTKIFFKDCTSENRRKLQNPALSSCTKHNRFDL